MTRHQLREWFKVVVLFLLVLAISYASEHLLQLHWDGFVGYRTPYAFDLAPPESGEGVSRRVVVVVIDALRSDFVPLMESWERVRDDGASLELRGSVPSQTIPSWATILTGTDPEMHGATTGLYSKPLQVDHIAAAARRAGLPVHFSGNRLWEPLIDQHLTGRHYEFIDPLGHPGPEADERAARATIAALDREDQGLFLLNLTTLRNVALRQGAQRPNDRVRPYERRLYAQDEILIELLDSLDLRRDTVLLTASHGTVRRGAHGGHEPAVTDIAAVAAGAGIRPGAGASGFLRDLAPTTAVLLGTGIPAHSIGVPLLPVLDLTEEERAAAAERTLRAQQSFYREAMAALGGGTPDNSTSIDPSELAARAEQLRATAAGLVREARATERDERTEMLLGLGLTAILWLGIIRAGGYRAALVGIGLTVAIGFGLIFAMGGRLSFTDFRSTEHLAVWFRGMRAHGILLAGSLGMAAGLLTGRRGSYTRPELFATALHTLANGMIALMLFAVAYTYWFGFTATWGLPDGPLWVANLSSLIFVTAMGQLAVLGLALSWLGAVLTVNWWLD